MIKKKIVATNFTSMVRYTAFKSDPCHFVSLIFRSRSLYSENRLEPLKDWIRLFFYCQIDFFFKLMR